MGLKRAGNRKRFVDTLEVCEYYQPIILPGSVEHDYQQRPPPITVEGLEDDEKYMLRIVYGDGRLTLDNQAGQ